MHFLASKLGQGCFGPVSNELDRIEEVFFLCAQLLKAIFLGQVFQLEMLSKGFALCLELLDLLTAVFNGLLELAFAEFVGLDLFWLQVLAFLAGLAVNAAVKNKPAKEKLEFFGNSFFIPIFLW